MRRRTLIQSAMAGAAIGGFGSRALESEAFARTTQTLPPAAWKPLETLLGDRLLHVHSPLAACVEASGTGADRLFAELKNPYFLSEDPALTQTLGWTDAWTSAASTRAVAAQGPADVAAAVRFAARHRLRLAVKGGGHSYFGNSNAAGSLLVWTRPMQAIEMHEGFRPKGAPADVAPVPAVSVGTGLRWGEVYRAVSVAGGRYVQGGGCLTVGVAGFVLGGGFGSFSRQFGTGAANLLEAEVVTADGRIRIANAHQEPELFFALKGGGGGTFGIATRLTLATHPLPATIGAVQFEVEASSDSAWAELVARMLGFYAEHLFNAHWGEQLGFAPGRRMSVAFVWQGLDLAGIKACWDPFFAFLSGRPNDFRFPEPRIHAADGRQFWDPAYLRSLPGVVLADDRPGASPDNLYWASNRGEAGQIIHAYQSVWLSQRLLAPDRRKTLVQALLDASQHWRVTLHTNKGLAGSVPDALARTAGTATNPNVLDAFALLICAANGEPAWAGIPGHEPDRADGLRKAAAVTRAMAPMRAIAGNMGTYVSEADWFADGWAEAYWGTHLERLKAARRRYDPGGFFAGHHIVPPA